LGNIYGEEEAWKFAPSTASKVFADYIKEAGIPVIYNKRINKVVKKNTNLYPPESYTSQSLPIRRNEFTFYRRQE
jgi:hypothetical protein